MRIVHVVLPNDIDDPATPSGGNSYDRRVCRGLAAAGWNVREHAVPGGWPRPTPAERADLAARLATVPDNDLVLLDGLVASAAPDALVPHAGRLRLAVLMHMPLADDAERAALAAATAVVATSGWTRRRLLDLYGLPAARITVARPGVDPAPVTAASEGGGRLLCVAALTPEKGHDLLIDALARLTDSRWACALVGSLTRDPAFVARIGELIGRAGLTGRVRAVGPRTGADLADAYAATDLLVLASRGETYGMVLSEALARAVPVLVTDVGGVREALGAGVAAFAATPAAGVGARQVGPGDGEVPGFLVPPEDPEALAGALTAWLGDAALRDRLRRTAAQRRTTLPTWADTAELVGQALAEVAA